jgi:GDSL-like lipase/acylhydrolase family protein/carbohydrate esterase-like protein
MSDPIPHTTQSARWRQGILLPSIAALALTAVLVGCYALTALPRQADHLATTPTTRALPNDPNWFCSPGNWHIRGSEYARTNSPGAYCKFRFSGTGLELAVSLDEFEATSPSADEYPYLKWKIDAGPFMEVRLGASTAAVALARGLPPGDHTVEVYLESIRRNIDRWNTPSASIDFTSVTVRGGHLIEPAPRTQRWLAFGDSRTEGINVDGSSYSNADQAAARSWAIQVAEALDAEIGVVGWVSQGWNHPSTPASNVGAYHNGVANTWSELWNGQARSFSGIDAVLVNHGFNDGASTDEQLAGYLENFLSSLRAACPDAAIYLVVPFGSSNMDRRAVYDSAVTSYRAVSGDSRVWVISINGKNPTLDEDLDGDLTYGHTYTTDSIHPNQAGHDAIAALVITEITNLRGS